MTAKQRAISFIEDASDSQLERFIRSQGYDHSVNWLTRGAVESKIIEKLDDYSNEQIGDFLKKL